MRRCGLGVEKVENNVQREINMGDYLEKELAQELDENAGGVDEEELVSIVVAQIFLPGICEDFYWESLRVGEFGTGTWLQSVIIQGCLISIKIAMAEK